MVISRIRIFLISAFLIGISNFAILPAQSAEYEKLAYKNSEVSFTGDDSFVTGRYVRKPLMSNHIWNERLTFSGGVIYFSELDPGYFYTGQNAGIHTFRDIFNRNSNHKRRGLSINVDDILELSNASGDYYLAAKSNDNSSCAMAKQFSGDSNPNGGRMAVGNRVATALICKGKSWGLRDKLITQLKGIMDRARYDEGKLNKQRAATK